MKKTLVVLTVMVLLGGCIHVGFGAEKELPPALTEIGRFEKELDRATQQRAHFLKLAKEYEYKMIQLDAIIQYIKEKELEDKTTKEEK